MYEPAIERAKHSLTFRIRRICHHSNETCAPIANLTNSAQLEVPHNIPLCYIRVCAAACECGEGQTDTQTVVGNIHFASAMPHAKCNKGEYLCSKPHRVAAFNLLVSVEYVLEVLWRWFQIVDAAEAL